MVGEKRLLLYYTTDYSFYVPAKATERPRVNESVLQAVQAFKMTLLSDRYINNEADPRKRKDRWTTSIFVLSVQEERDCEYQQKTSTNLTSRQRHLKDLLKETKAGNEMESCIDVKLVGILSPLQQLLLSEYEATASTSKMLDSRVGRVLASNIAHDEELNCTAPENEKQLEQACRAAFSGDTGSLHEVLTTNSELVKMRWCGLTLIHVAAFGGHVENVRILISAGADVNSTMEQCEWPRHSPGDQMETLEPDNDLSWGVNCDCVSPLMLAVAENHIEVVELLLDSEADCNQISKDPNFMNPLFYAVDKGLVELVHLLLNRGAHVDLQVGWKRQTMIHVVKDSQLARLLIDRGLSVDNTDKNGCTSLHYAAARQIIEIVSQLLEHNADINAEDLFGETPLYHALNGRCTPELIEFLINQGSDIKHRTNVERRTPLHKAILSASCSYGVIKLLIDSGSDVNAVDFEGKTPLHLAFEVSENLNCDVVKLLLDNGANVEAADKFGQVPLHLSSALGNIDAARILLDSNSNVNAVTTLAVLPIHFATRAGNAHLVKLLIEKGSELNRLVLDWDKLDVDQSRPQMMSALTIATGQRNLEVIKVLLEHGADVDVREEYGSTALHIATKISCLPAVSLLLQHGADANKIGGSPKTTAVNIAASQGLTAILELLVRFGGDVNAIDEDGATPLHCASKNGCVKTVRYLLENGANVKAFTDSNWSTALHIAATLKSSKILKLLLDYGADVHAADGNDRTSLDVAVKHGRNQNRLILLRRSSKTGRPEDLFRFVSLHSAAGIK